MIVNSFYTLLVKVFNICHTFHRPNMLVTLILRMSGTWNMEHGIFRNILEYEIIIIMRKMSKIYFSKIKLNKNKLIEAERGQTI